jgi:hypothetical protein
MKVNPREIFKVEKISFSDIRLGDVIRCGGWNRPRVVIQQDGDATGPVFFLADPDDRFEKQPRKLNQSEFQNRGPTWLRYAVLSELWRKATGVKLAAPKAAEGGTA